MSKKNETVETVVETVVSNPAAPVVVRETPKEILERVAKIPVVMPGGTIARLSCPVDPSKQTKQGIFRHNAKKGVVKAKGTQWTGAHSALAKNGILPETDKEGTLKEYEVPLTEKDFLALFGE